jgi:hypothetical protein
MSRSYKKAIFQAAGCKDMKKDANRCVRRQDEVPDGKAYRKVFSSYSICDIKYKPKKQDRPWNDKFFMRDNRWMVWK